jgi:C4-dicarboxylate-specific signal transduction histidine kinase
MVASGISYTYQTGKKRDIKEIIPQIEEINRQTDRINNIIGQLRSLMRRGEIRAEPCDINEVVEQSLCLLKHRLVAHGINVKTCLTKGLPRFLATLTALEEIIINLLVNAMQALDTIDRPDKEIVLKTHFDGGVVLLVSDNGPGINADVGEKIFEPFISDRPGEDNLGLGLAIVNSLVASYGGTIGYESGEETGTVFIVKFPAGEK